MARTKQYLILLTSPYPVWQAQTENNNLSISVLLIFSFNQTVSPMANNVHTLAYKETALHTQALQLVLQAQHLLAHRKDSYEAERLYRCFIRAHSRWISEQYTERGKGAGLVDGHREMRIEVLHDNPGRLKLSSGRIMEGRGGDGTTRGTKPVARQTPSTVDRHTEGESHDIAAVPNHQHPQILAANPAGTASEEFGHILTTPCVLFDGTVLQIHSHARHPNPSFLTLLYTISWRPHDFVGPPTQWVAHPSALIYYRDLVHDYHRRHRLAALPSWPVRGRPRSSASLGVREIKRALEERRCTLITGGMSVEDATMEVAVLRWRMRDEWQRGGRGWGCARDIVAKWREVWVKEKGRGRAIVAMELDGAVLPDNMAVNPKKLADRKLSEDAISYPSKTILPGHHRLLEDPEQRPEPKLARRMSLAGPHLGHETLPVSHPTVSDSCRIFKTNESVSIQGEPKRSGSVFEIVLPGLFSEQTQQHQQQVPDDSPHSPPMSYNRPEDLREVSLQVAPPAPTWNGSQAPLLVSTHPSTTNDKCLLANIILKLSKRNRKWRSIGRRFESEGASLPIGTTGCARSDGGC